MKPVRGTPIEARPERGFANGLASGRHHVAVIVGDPTHHMSVRLYVAHISRNGRSFQGFINFTTFD